MTARRKPVPAAFRAQHELSVSSHVAGGRTRGVTPYRARGRCACGVEFNPTRLPDGSWSRSDTMDRADVIDAWKDHVAQACHGDDYYTVTA